VAGPARRRATDLLVTVEVASFMVGPAVGGLLLAGPARPFVGVLAVGLTGLALVAVRRIALPGPVRAPRAESAQRAGHARAERAPRAQRAGHARAERAPTIERAIGVAAAVNAVVAATTLTLLPVVEGAWHGGGTGYGTAIAALGIGGLGAPLLWWLGRSAVSRGRRGMLACGLALGLLALVPALVWGVPVLLVLGAASVQVEGAVTETLQDAVPDERRAGVLGLADSVMVGAALLASLLTPWLVGRLGPHTLLLAMAVGCAVVVAGPRRSAQREPETSVSRGSRRSEAAAPSVPG
jgi:MFS transporter